MPKNIVWVQGWRPKHSYHCTPWASKGAATNVPRVCSNLPGVCNNLPGVCSDLHPWYPPPLPRWSLILLHWPPIAPPGAPKIRDHVKRHCGLESNISIDHCSCSRCSIDYCVRCTRRPSSTSIAWSGSWSCRYSTATLTCPSWTTLLRLLRHNRPWPLWSRSTLDLGWHHIWFYLVFYIKYSRFANLEFIGIWI